MCERSDSWPHLKEHCKRSSQRGSAVVVRWGRGSLCRIGLDHLLQLSGRSRRGHSASFKLHRRHLFPKKGRIHNEWRGGLSRLSLVWMCGVRRARVRGGGSEHTGADHDSFVRGRGYRPPPTTHVRPSHRGNPLPRAIKAFFAPTRGLRQELLCGRRRQTYRWVGRTRLTHGGKGGGREGRNLRV